MRELRKKKDDEILGPIIKHWKILSLFIVSFLIFINIENMGLLVNYEFISQMYKILLFSLPLVC